MHRVWNTLSLTPSKLCANIQSAVSPLPQRVQYLCICNHSIWLTWLYISSELFKSEPLAVHAGLTCGFWFSGAFAWSYETYILVWKVQQAAHAEILFQRGHHVTKSNRIKACHWKGPTGSLSTNTCYCIYRKSYRSPERSSEGQGSLLP